jgi:hypothetical protein
MPFGVAKGHSLFVPTSSELRAPCCTLPPVICSTPQGASLLDLTAVSSVEDLSAVKLATAYARRNFTVSLQGAAGSVWKAESGVPIPASTSASLEAVAALPRTFDLSLHAVVKPVAVWLRPQLSEVLKWALVQYLAFWFVIYVASQWIKSYAFETRLLGSFRRDDLPGGRKAAMS